MTPTADHEGNPTVCHCCGMRAIGIGVGAPRGDPRYLCRECVHIIEHVRKVRRMDPYELKAREGGMEAAGPLVEEFGPALDEWSEEQVLMFCGTVWRGCADRLREILEVGDAPF